jgi:hypothetical protein
MSAALLIRQSQTLLMKQIYQMIDILQSRIRSLFSYHHREVKGYLKQGIPQYRMVVAMLQSRASQGSSRQTGSIYKCRRRLQSVSARRATQITFPSLR